MALNYPLPRIGADVMHNPQTRGSMTNQSNTQAALREALQQIANWASHPSDLGVNFGSNGVRDFYRQLARNALAAQPTPEPAPVEALRKDFARECVDTDTLLRLLGFEPNDVRTDGGSLNLQRLANLIEARKATPEPVAQADEINAMADRAYSRFAFAMGDSPGAPYPGMAAAFESHFGQSWIDKDWRNEASVWAAAWRKAWDKRGELSAPSPVALQGRDELAWVAAELAAELTRIHGLLQAGKSSIPAMAHWTRINSLRNRVQARAARASLPAGGVVEPVGKIVLFGGDPDQKEVAWTKGKMPPVGTKLFATSLPAGGVVEPATRSAWWAIAMGAAASLEDASHCLRDTDAKAAAIGAAAHVRKQCHALWDATQQPSETPAPIPIPMVLHCPECGMQHIDGPEHQRRQGAPGITLEPWDNPDHRSHLCHGCGTIWRPADVPTTGVKEIKTRGKKDTWPHE